MKRLFAGLMAASVAMTPMVAAADYPERPISVVFPNQAGSTYYTIALAILTEMEDDIGQPTGIQAMPGAGTALGARFVAEQAPDGYTLLFIHEGVLQVGILGMLGFDPTEVFEPLASVVGTYSTIWARADAPYDNFTELAEYAQTHPGEVRSAIQTGAPSHVQMAAFADTIGAGKEIRPVHTGGGGAGARQSLLAGDIDLIGDNPTGMAGMMKAGQVKPLGVLGPKRNAAIPDIPTLEEQGFEPNGTEGLHGYFWIRRDAPEDVKTFWRTKLEVALTDPDREAALEELLGLDIEYEGGPELDEKVKGLYSGRKTIMESHGIGG